MNSRYNSFVLHALDLEENTQNSTDDMFYIYIYINSTLLSAFMDGHSIYIASFFPYLSESTTLKYANLETSVVV